MMNILHGRNFHKNVMENSRSTGSEPTMVSTPYTRGRSREYQVLRKLRDEGWVCSRSAASHGPVDIFAGKDGRILMVQVKSGKGRASKEERELLKLWGKAFEAQVEIWRFRKGKPLEREIVYEH
jgi:Holliday junction resolvase-like predicted endonuclease